MSTAELLGGRYEVGGLLGRGGMAEVFNGVDVRLGRDVAVKVLRADLARDPAFQARFRREAQAAASLNAPSIVSVFDTGQDAAGVPYIVMERVDGRTLREVLQQEGRLLPTRALEIAADICSALDAAHAAGIVHRDIKPANVMLTRTGQVKVMDFGIARAAADASSAMTQTAAIVGTAAYLSPEQARGEHVDGRSDLYSTGCLLYELITGTPPFTGDSPVAVAYQHVREEPLPPSTYDETLPPAVDALVLTAMAKLPVHRYQSAQLMREDLLRASAGQPVLATPVREPVVPLAPAAATGPVRQRERRRGRVLAYAAFGLLLLGLVAAVALLVRGALSTDSGLVKAPSLVGLDQREAALLLARDGLRVGVIEQRSFIQGDRAAAPFGRVLEQSPPAGILLAEQGQVDLVVSAGIEQTIVPDDVVGLPREEAAVLLTERRLKLGPDVARNGNVPAGTVLAIRPAPGTQVPAETVVTLTVATGRVQVPDVRGQSREQAVSALQKAGFSVGVQPRESTGTVDRVLEQRPVGRLADRGTAVIIVVSVRPVPKPSPSPSPPPPPAPPVASPVPSPVPTPTAAPTPLPSPPASPAPPPSPPASPIP